MCAPGRTQPHTQRSARAPGLGLGPGWAFCRPARLLLRPEGRTAHGRGRRRPSGSTGSSDYDLQFAAPAASSTDASCRPAGGSRRAGVHPAGTRVAAPVGRRLEPQRSRRRDRARRARSLDACRRGGHARLRQRGGRVRPARAGGGRAARGPRRNAGQPAGDPARARARRAQAPDLPDRRGRPHADLRLGHVHRRRGGSGRRVRVRPAHAARPGASLADRRRRWTARIPSWASSTGSCRGCEPRLTWRRRLPRSSPAAPTRWS